MKRMSFFLTTRQMLDRSKTVTTRSARTWRNLKRGDELLCVKRGERQLPLSLIRVLETRLQRLDAISDDEARAEGFPELDAAGFVAMYQKHVKVASDALVRRIRFEHLPVVVVTQAPSTGDENRPIFGEQLRRLALLVGTRPTLAERRFDIRCLLRGSHRYLDDDKLPQADAIIAAKRLKATLLGRHVVALGPAVARAFGLYGTKWFEWESALQPAGKIAPRLGRDENLHPLARFVQVPHLGNSMWWNDPANARKAKRFWLETVGERHDIPEQSEIVL